MQAIVLVLRGLPAGWLGAYGNEWVATPHLDQFASEAVVFDQHFSDCPTEEAARRAWRTGRIQVPSMTGTEESPTDRDLVAELNAAGVRTVLLRANHPDTDVRGFDETWSEVIEARPQAEDESPLDEIERQFPKVLDRLGTASPWLLWVEIDRLLPPWDVPQEVFEAYLSDEEDDDDDEEPAATEDDEESDEDDETEEDSDIEEAEDIAEPVTPWSDPPVGPFDPKDMDARDWLHFSFAAVVTILDAEVGRLLDQVKAKGLDAAIVVTSDFGWPMGEHGQVGPHRPWLHEEFVHVPLLLRLPGGEAALRRIPALTQPADLKPTLLGLLGVGSDKGLLPLIRDEVAELRPYALTGLRIGDAAEWTLRTEEWMFLLPSEMQNPPREPALYAKPEDRWEMHDVQSLHRDWVERVKAFLPKAIAAARSGALLPLPE